MTRNDSRVVDKRHSSFFIQRYSHSIRNYYPLLRFSYTLLLARLKLKYQCDYMLWRMLQRNFLILTQGWVYTTLIS